MVYKKIGYFLIVLLIFSGVAQAGEVIVEPAGFNLDLVAGDIVTKSMNVTWTGSNAVVGFVTTPTCPCTGIDVNYSKDVLVLFPNEPVLLDMTITTAIDLVPDTYHIKTDIYTEVDTVIEQEIIYEEIVVYEEIENLSRINVLLNIIRELNQELNESKDNISSPHLAMLLNSINNATNLLLDEIGRIKDGESFIIKEEVDLLPIWIAIVLVFVVLLLLLMVIYKKYDKEMRKRTQETTIRRRHE